MRATYPAHLLLFDLIIPLIFGERHIFWNSSLCSTLVLNFKPCSSLNVRNQISQPYTNGNSRNELFKAYLCTYRPCMQYGITQCIINTSLEARIQDCKKRLMV
jgi:hypothetical protein